MNYIEILESMDGVRHVTPAMAEADRFYITIERDSKNSVVESIEEFRPEILSPRQITTSSAGNPIMEIQFGDTPREPVYSGDLR